MRLMRASKLGRQGRDSLLRPLRCWSLAFRRFPVLSLRRWCRELNKIIQPLAIANAAYECEQARMLERGLIASSTTGEINPLD
ncbi:hypothetical protein C2E31_28015 [Rhodopirellula baltica]|nr:hypothetical protein C2E31_28015 [Rhodopirellula baltica]